MAETYFLRRLRQEDAVRMLEWLRNEDVTRYLRAGGANMTLEDARAFIKRSACERPDLHRAVAGEDGRYCGTVSLKNIDLPAGEAEYAIALHPEAIGTSAAGRATEEILKLAFARLGLGRVYLTVLAENLRAVRFYEKYGFRRLGEERISFQGQPARLLQYEIRPETGGKERGT